MTSAVEGKGKGGRDTKGESGMKIGQVKHNKKKGKKKAGKPRPLVQTSKKGFSPVKGEVKPTSEGASTKEIAISAQGGSIPIQREVTPVQKGATPALGGANPAQGAILGQGGPLPGGEIKRNKKKCKKKAGKLRPLVQVPKHKFSPVKGGIKPTSEGAFTKELDISAQGATPFVQGGAIPVQRDVASALGGAILDHGGAISTLGEANLALEGAIQAKGEAVLGQREAVPAQKRDILNQEGATPAPGGANPAQGGAIGAKSEAILGQGGSIPGGEIKRNKKKCKKKVGKVRPLVEVSRRGYDPTQSGAVPAQGGAIPTQGGAIDAQKGTIPSQGEAIVTQKVAIPAKEGVIPAQGGAIPVQGGVIPTQGRVIPTQGGVISTQGGAKTKQGGDIPAQSGAISAKVIAKPAQGETISASFAANSVQGGAIPSKVGIKPKKKANVPQKGKRDSVTKGKNLSPKRKMLKTSKDHMTLEGDLLEEYLRRVEKRNQRTLYVKVPSAVDINDAKILKPLFNDAASMRFPRHKMYGYCYIEYESQKKAEKMKPILEEIEILGRRCEVDFVGAKSKNYIPPKVICVYPKELFLDGLPSGTTYEDLRSTFCTAQIIQTKKFLKKGNAYIMYKRKEEAEKVFREQGGLRVNGREVMVLYVKASPSEQSTDPEAKRRKVDDTAKRKQDLKDL
ncbi:SUMO-interacting motif-containing protein 1-like [Penaeus indicus]|uniref:SUMO-interacting motif-containing protein 1-like n=1 Tax=Penaeus indicus TaxID=29960 RepID=UPI00300C4198